MTSRTSFPGQATASGAPCKPKQLGMFWRFLFTLFLSSIVGMELNVLGVTLYEEHTLIQRLESQEFAADLQKEALAHRETFEAARRNPELCPRVLNSMMVNSRFLTFFSDKGPNSARKMLNEGRLSMELTSKGEPVCRYPAVRDAKASAPPAFRFSAGIASAGGTPAEVTLTVRPLRSPELLWETNKGIPWNFFVFFMVVLNVCCAFTLAPILVRRIKRAEVVARGWTQGDMQARIDDTRTDEFGSLVRSFNTMADSFEGVIRTEQELAAAQERNRLARDLHDTAKQRAFALNLQLTALNALRGSNPAEAEKLIASALSLVHHLQSDLSNVIKRLSASTVVELGTREVLRQELQSLFQGSGIGWDVHIPEAIDALLKQANAVAQQLLLIVIEAAANVLKHSEASTFSVALFQDKQGYVLLLEDDGKGFDVNQTPATGMGLASMKLRARGLPDGDFVVTKLEDGRVQIAVHFTIRGKP